MLSARGVDKFRTLSSSRGNRYWIDMALVAITIAMVLWANVATYRHQRSLGAENTRDSQMRRDPIDVIPLLLRTGQCHAFAQTSAYWHEEYTPGVPFYRPLSLTFFWIERQLLGTGDFSTWTLFSCCLNVFFCGLFGILIWQMTGSIAIAALSVLLFSGPRDLPGMFSLLRFFDLNDTPPASVAMAWKDQPDLLSDCAMVTAIIFALRCRWAPALLAAVAAVLFKESGWITYAMALIVLAGNGKIRSIPTHTYYAAALCVALPMAARAASGMGLIGGEHLGSNRHWLERYLYGVGGAYVNDSLHGYWPECFYGTGIYLVLRSNRPTWLRGAALLSLTAAAALLTGRQMQTPANIGLLMLFDPTIELPCVLFSALFSMAIGCLLADRTLWKPASLFVCLSLVAGLPYVAATQVSVHALYLCFAFQCGFLATVWIAVGRTIIRSLTQHKWFRSRLDLLQYSKETQT